MEHTRASQSTSILPPNRSKLECFTLADACQSLKIPLLCSYIEAGFPSPVEGDLDQALDLNELLIEHPHATFFIRVRGESMSGAGIFPNDLLVVDRAQTSRSGDVVVAALNGEFTVKRFVRIGQNIRLVAAHPQYRDIPVGPNDDFIVWGVVRYVIHRP